METADGGPAPAPGAPMRVWTEAVGPSGRLTCYVQQPSARLTSAGVRPAVLVLPGGGFEYCTDREAEPVALAYLAEGFNAFVLSYAVGPSASWQQAFEDALGALEWLRAHPDRGHLDAAKVAVVGFSAGGHLAAALATRAPVRPDAVILGYPLTRADVGHAVTKPIPDLVPEVDPTTPATFLFHTAPDAVVPVRHSLDFLAALADAGVPLEAHLYLAGPHAMSLAKPLTANGIAANVDPPVARWFVDSVVFLHRVLGDFAVGST